MIRSYEKYGVVGCDCPALRVLLDFIPHIFVWGSCFWFCIPPPSSSPPPPPPAASRHHTYNLSSHNSHTTQLTHNLLTYNSTHTTCSHTTQLTHNLLTYHTYNLSSYNLLTHNSTHTQFALPPPPVITHTTCHHTTHTQLNSHTACSHTTQLTQLAHTQLNSHTTCSHIAHATCHHITCSHTTQLADVVPGPWGPFWLTVSWHKRR